MPPIPVRFGDALRQIHVRDAVVTSSPLPVAPPPPSKAGPAVAELLESLQEAFGELEARRKSSLAELQEVAIELAMAAATHVVRQTLDRDQFGIDTVVGEMLQRISANEPVRVALNPDDLRQLTGKGSSPWPEGLVEFRPDPTLTRGCCRAVSGSRTVISDWRTHLQEARAALHEELEHAQIERRGAEAADQRVKRFPDRRETA